MPGELEYAGQGVSYCAVCDGAFFKGETIAVVGGGDAAVEEADYLTRYAEKVYVIHRRDEFRASKILQERLFANPKIEVIWNKRVRELTGGPRVCSDRAGGHRDGGAMSLEATGCFIFIGFKPNTGLVRHHFEHDAAGYMITDDRMMTSIPGLFAAGDVRVQLTRQVTTAVGDATTAAIAVEKYLKDRQQRERRRPRPVSELEVVTLPNGQLVENCYLVADRRTRRGRDDRSRRGAGDVPRRAGYPGLVAAGHLAHPRARRSHHRRRSGACMPRARRSTCTRSTGHLRRAAAVRQLGRDASRSAAPAGRRSPSRRVLAGRTASVRGAPHARATRPGSVSFVGEGLVFCGDALFNGSIGRTDLPGGDYATLMASIQSQLLSLPDSTIVHSGHGAETTIGVERLTNPFLTGAYRLG